MSVFFDKIPHVRYEGRDSVNPFAFRWYDPDAVIEGKTMREQLRFALSYWHTMCGEGTDMFGRGTYDKSFGGRSAMEIYKNKADAAFELMDKLDVDYFCFHDRDIAPEGETLAETNGYLSEMADYIGALMQKSGKKLLWGTANCFNHPRYMHGAGTAPNADVFAYAAAQIKKALEVTVKLGGKGYVFWGGREGYETLLNTDMKLELDNMAYLMRLAVDYGRSIGFDGDFYIEPKPKEPTKHQYDFDAATVIGFLKTHGLDKDFKLNIEANHATLAGHTFQHELAVARVNGAFGSIDANQGDMLLGWDTDQFPTDVYTTAMCMLEVLRAGGFTNGGLNFDAKTRRGSYTPEDIAHAYIAGMDAYALGLRIAAAIRADGRVDEFVDARYESYKSGIGAKILGRQTSLAELESYALAMGEVTTNISGRQEYLENIVNAVMFGGKI
ncbi:MAG: xylose isomerase [Ruminococcaceae bacterium]|nr:xylose isomerase [Oscillospiraceae bacterium]